ncbi:30S ribosomal protein S6--L-glutamate ligase [Parvularcula dongshanensis]|uniref:Probable alpha-L-glutamate ligase n=1 Tax=Parvularcula dongshanensis TaxID=1173995 RepID=A0A840I1M1_9PROT|nr:30S ribosomal protein S6--L-glutamate ligase [Parvularcula dongshanensis]MBB4658181.1 ribosomal protein S6--L-glutamate ligase [Parvularcula dongshanensis]
MSETLTLGWEEWCALPKLGLPALKAKVDTGAKTSALHAFTIEPFGRAGKMKVRFGIHPIPERPELEIYCSADVVDRRDVTSSNGETETRWVIETPIRMGDQEWPVQVTLSDREGMQFHMLLGRQALQAYPHDDEPRVVPSVAFQQPKLSYDVYEGMQNERPTKRSLRVAILTREPGSYSTSRLVEAGETREHVVECIDTQRCYMLINAGRPEVHYDGKPLPFYDAVIPRIGASITAYGTAVVRQFEAIGSYVLNRSASITASRDKLYAHQVLARDGIGMPTTAFASSPKDTADLIELMGEPPIIVKLLESSQGRGVVLAETKKAADSVISAFRDLRADFLVQQFVKEAGGEDIRCLVVGGKVVAAMKRTAAPGEFRSNLHQGGSATAEKITKKERETAVQAAKTFGLGLAGVDLLRASTGPKVLEVNSSPGLEGIEKSSGKDVAGLVYDQIEKRAASIKRRRRRAGAVTA